MNLCAENDAQLCFGHDAGNSANKRFSPASPLSSWLILVKFWHISSALFMPLHSLSAAVLQPKAHSVYQAGQKCATSSNQTLCPGATTSSPCRWYTIFPTRLLGMQRPLLKHPVVVGMCRISDRSRIQDRRGNQEIRKLRVTWGMWAKPGLTS